MLWSLVRGQGSYFPELQPKGKTQDLRTWRKKYAQVQRWHSPWARLPHLYHPSLFFSLPPPFTLSLFRIHSIPSSNSGYLGYILLLSFGFPNSDHLLLYPPPLWSLAPLELILCIYPHGNSTNYLVQFCKYLFIELSQYARHSGYRDKKSLFSALRELQETRE